MNAISPIVTADPFFITGPAAISFSGGRTSGYMLWRILQAHGGTLPADVVVCFANTGREMEATLRFVHDCATYWNVPVRWLEFRRDRDTGRRYAEEVGFNSASRDGEPFEMLLEGWKMLPNPVMRFCTTELKIRTMHRWRVQQFGAAIDWLNVVGLRADEPRRVERMRDPGRAKKRGDEAKRVAMPLADAGIAKADVMAFWAAQNFDLGLKGAWEGNCDGCFLKRAAAIARMSRDYPERMAWWAEVEADMASDKAIKPEVARFRMDRPSYAAIAAAEMAQARMDLDVDDDGADVFAACDTGCGV